MRISIWLGAFVFGVAQFVPSLSMIPLVSYEESARAACTPNRVSDYPTFRWVASRRYDGGTRHDGVKVRISHYNPFVDPVNPNGTPSTSYVSAWAMLRWTGNYYAYAQAGWIKSANGDYKSFTEWRLSNGVPVQAKFPAPSFGTYAEYKVEWSESGGTKKINFYRDGTLLGNANQVVWWTPQYSEISGETHSARDQMPWGRAHATTFS
jgi:hypothetical protein